MVCTGRIQTSSHPSVLTRHLQRLPLRPLSDAFGVHVQEVGQVGVRARVLDQLCGDARLPWRKHGCPDAVAAVLRGLHDHMAIRTVHNPDVAQRAAALGLQQNVDDLNTKGYVRAARPASKSPTADPALC